jgi:DNA-binding LytR/AlgR family response regulator
MQKSVNCIIVDDESVARDILATHLSKIDNINIVASCSNAIEAFNVISSNTIDLIFLDINMPEISGISFAKSINKNSKIIFTTAYREYAVDVFELQAVDYLLKPISFERLVKAVNLFFEVYTNAEVETSKEEVPNDFTFVRSDRKMIKIDFKNIIYIESLGDYVKFHLYDKILTTRDTISAIEAKLPKGSFIRIHRSFIVAMGQISSFTNEHITINNKALPISRSYKKDVLQLLEKF